MALDLSHLHRNLSSFYWRVRKPASLEDAVFEPTVFLQKSVLQVGFGGGVVVSTTHFHIKIIFFPLWVSQCPFALCNTLASIHCHFLAFMDNKDCNASNEANAHDKKGDNSICAVSPSLTVENGRINTYSPSNLMGTDDICMF